MPQTIFESCVPRPDVAAGTTKDEQFAADLAQVIRGTAPDEYRVPAVFFRNSYPTRGMKELLKAVCQRLSGRGGEVGSVFRLDTQYGGGKTHGLIALVHAVKGMTGVANVAEFVDPALLPKGKVRVAALDGENSDPADGLTLGEAACGPTASGATWRTSWPGPRATAGSRTATGSTSPPGPRRSASCSAASRR